MSQIFIPVNSGGGGSVTSVTGANGITASPTTGAVIVSGVNALADGSTKGVATFNSTEFLSTVPGVITSQPITVALSGGLTGSSSVNLGGTLTLGFAGGGSAIESVTVQKGVSPVLPNGSGNITISGNFVAGNAGNNPVATDGNIANGFTVEVQTATAQALSASANLGLASFNSANFSVDANGFVSSITGSFKWVDVTTATQTLAVQTGYVTDHTNVTYTLPATANLGDQIRIVGKLGITTIAQRAGQQILMSSASSTVGVGGSIAGTNVGDCVWLVCITSGASTVWSGESFVGNWTVT